MTSVSETSLVGRLESGPDASRDYGLHLRKYQALCDEAKETIGRLTRELGRVGSQNYRLIVELADMKSRALTAEAQRDGALTPDQREAAAKALAAKMLSTEWTDLRPFTRAKYRSAILTMERIIRAAKGAA